MYTRARSNLTSLKKYFQKRKKLSTIIGLLLIIILTATGRNIYQSLKPPVVETVVVSSASITKKLEVPGEIKAGESVLLRFPYSGKLAWIKVKEGDRVQKWQALAGLDTRTLQRELLQDLLAFEKEYRDYQQAVEDNPQVNLRFKRILEKAQFDLQSEVVGVEIRQLALELATLISPIDGIVVSIDTPVAGVNVTTQDTIEIVNPENLYFKAEVDESDIGAVAVGQPATIRLDAFPEESIQSEVMAVDFAASVAEGSGTVFHVSLSLPPSQATPFRLGMSGDAQIVLAQKPAALVIPLATLTERDGSFTVDVLEDDQRVRQRPVKIGLQTEDLVEVISGLSEYDRVVLPR